MPMMTSPWRMPARSAPEPPITDRTGDGHAASASSTTPS